MQGENVARTARHLQPQAAGVKDSRSKNQDSRTIQEPRFKRPLREERWPGCPEQKIRADFSVFDTAGACAEFSPRLGPCHLFHPMRAFLFLAVLSLVPLYGIQADPVGEMGAFSVFGNVDLGNLREIATKRGPEMSVGRDLSVQSCYVVPGPPAKALAALEQWDASRHRELQIYVHGDLPVAPTPASFSRLAGAPENDAVKELVRLTQKGSTELQLTKDEAKRLGCRQWWREQRGHAGGRANLLGWRAGRERRAELCLRRGGRSSQGTISPARMSGPARNWRGCCASRIRSGNSLRVFSTTPVSWAAGDRSKRTCISS